MKSLTKKDSGIVYLLALLVPQIIGGIVLGIYCSFFDSQNLAVQSQFYLYLSGLIPQICFCAIFFGYSKTSKFNYNQQLGINRKPTIKNCLIIILISIILFVSLYYFIDLLNVFFDYLGLPIEKFNIVITNNNFGLLIINLIVFACLPAIFEELIYRGLIFSGLRSYGKWYAILLSAVMFSIMHLNPLQFVYPLIIGIILGIIFDKTKCLYYTMIFHFCNNFLVLIVNYFDGLFIFNLKYNISFLTVLLILLGAIIGILAVLLILKKAFTSEPISDSDNYKQPHKSSNSLYLYISFAVGIVLWIMALITTLKG